MKTAKISNTDSLKWHIKILNILLFTISPVHHTCNITMVTRPAMRKKSKEILFHYVHTHMKFITNK